MASEPLAFGYDYILKRGVNVPFGRGAGEGSQGAGQEKLEVAPPERTAKGGAKGSADRAIHRNHLTSTGGGGEGGIRTHGRITAQMPGSVGHQSSVGESESVEPTS